MMSALERLVGEMGFTDIPLKIFLKEAQIDPNIFYRRYHTVSDLFGRLAGNYDFWLNDTFNVSGLNEFGAKKFYAEALKKLFVELSKNKVMQKLLLYELSQNNETTRRTADMRETMNLNIVAYYKRIFAPSEIDIQCVTSLLISGIYYLVLYKERSTFCSIDFNSSEGEKTFNAAIDKLVDILFEQTEHKQKQADIIRRMQDDGISQAKICDYLGITPGKLRKYLK